MREALKDCEPGGGEGAPDIDADWGEPGLTPAERVFGEADWLILDRAFGTHRDPLTGGEPEAPYAELFRTIVRITP